MKRKHVDACPKSCKTIHKMCDWKGCASRGKHFASDHVSVFAKPTHTPGPWTVDEPEPYELEIKAPRIGAIAKVWMDDACHDLHSENRADARLIAAAPELLSALKRAVQICEVNDGRLDRGFDPIQDRQAESDARAAIAKAEGR